MKRIEQNPGSADILVCGFRGLSSPQFPRGAKDTELESSVNPQTRMSALQRGAIGAAPFPFFRAGAQSRIHWIHNRVMATPIHVLLIANKVIKRFRLPKWLTRPLKEFVHFSRRKSLPTLQDGAQRSVGERTQDRVN